ncbi:uncharacterized protein LOC113777480 [Coffea eugenioides]|uniref:uncharacterized protein LOC113777480 n=1 Tax=Coffea eugenioides TaxID=49369 RepID=UPI000F614969|nr:uncharacterized protein LOC113777480 [Coffea eugenioides]XP_027178383.1 uncharacterized protein LOC113777480 [Coffea eugenioides]
MVTDWSKLQASTAAPPRTLNVQKLAESRADELHSLHSIVGTCLHNNFRSQRNKRRRTTSHIKKRFRYDNSNNGLLETDEKRLPRRIRRTIDLKKNPLTDFATSGDGTKRLSTHVWHAKRFTMSKLWGFYLPLGLHGRGKGSRALLKKSKQGVLVHDSSYYSAVQLEGPEDLLLLILSQVLVPSPLETSDQTSQHILAGVTYGSAMLHHVGAVFAQPVAPVTYMWRPQNPILTARVDKIDNKDEQQSIDRYASSRQLWIWIHPAAFREGYDVLESACETANLNGRSVNCISLEGKLGKLDLIGPKAFQLMQNILHPLTCSTNSWAVQKCSVAVNNNKSSTTYSCSLPQEDQISTSVMISLTVKDPRAIAEKGFAVLPETKPSKDLGAKETNTQGDTTSERILPWNPGSLSSLLSNPEEKYRFSEFIDLWDVSKGVNPPVEESFLCKKKHSQLIKIFSIGEKTSNKLDASGVRQYSQLCPIMLLKDNSGKGFTTSWSAILPLSWVKVFWIAIISNGGLAIGLRERHWITSEAGLPYFPSDFPDTNAYSCFMAMEAAIADQKEKLRPPSLRPFRVPHFPPWDCIHYGSEERSTVGVTKFLPVSNNSMKILNCKNCDVADVGSRGAVFNGVVARTSDVLLHFVSHVKDDNLLLFPNSLDGKRCLTKVMKDNELITHQTNGISSQLMCCQKLCFVRVLLHAYKEGVFEEGAVVCAPHPGDITMWSSTRLDDAGKFQAPQSLPGSYFVQQPSGRWALQVPEDPVVRESFRWPIGFITTGFIQGSKKPMAIALCEVALLARLREDQWKTISVSERRKEIYVLVRNLRSTAYRLALATIVLEAQEEDLEFM